MSEQPDAVELLRVARSTLLGEIVAGLPAEKRYTALMIANALAIAARECGEAFQDLSSELEPLASLYPKTAPGDIPDGDAALLEHLERRLAADIRTGVFDGELAEPLRRILLEGVRAKLRISNPKHLLSWGLES